VWAEGFNGVFQLHSRRLDVHADSLLDLGDDILYSNRSVKAVVVVSFADENERLISEGIPQMKRLRLSLLQCGFMQGFRLYVLSDVVRRRLGGEPAWKQEVACVSVGNLYYFTNVAQGFNGCGQQYSNDGHHSSIQRFT